MLSFLRLYNSFNFFFSSLYCNFLFFFYSHFIFFSWLGTNIFFLFGLYVLINKNRIHFVNVIKKNNNNFNSLWILSVIRIFTIHPKKYRKKKLFYRTKNDYSVGLFVFNFVWWFWSIKNVRYSIVWHWSQFFWAGNIFTLNYQFNRTNNYAHRFIEKKRISHSNQKLISMQKRLNDYTKIQNNKKKVNLYSK